MKGWEPGDRIEWSHYYPDGRVVVRTGVIWDRAPEVAGAQVVAWVTPDGRLPSDLYACIAVGKSSRRDNKVHGERTPVDSWQCAPKGQAYSSNYAGSPLGTLAVSAARAAGRHRAQNARATA